MHNGQKNKTEIPQLPQDLIDKLTKPIKRFLHIQASASLVLLLFTVIALVLSHSMWGMLSLRFGKRRWVSMSARLYSSVHFVNG